MGISTWRKRQVPELRGRNESRVTVRPAMSGHPGGIASSELPRQIGQEQRLTTATVYERVFEATEDQVVEP